VLHNGQGFTGERRFGGLQGGGFEQACIRADLVTSTDQEDVSRNKIASFDNRFAAVPHDADFESREFPQSGHGVLGPAFLNGTDDGIDQDDDEDDHRITRMRHGERDDGGGEEDVDERAGELRGEDLPHGLVGGLGQFIGAVLHEPCCDFGT